MTSPLAFYNPRSRQVGVVLMTGLLGTTMAFFMTLYLPGYGDTVTVTDGTSLYVVARQRAPQTPGPQFFFARSRDGTSFDPPNFRSGAPVAGAVVKGDLYCLFSEGRITRFGETKDDWQPIPFTLDWPIRGLTAFDNTLWAVGQDVGKQEIHTATLDNGTWKPGPVYSYAGDNIVALQGVGSGDRRFLLWLTMSEESPGRRYTVGGGRLEDDRLEALPSLSLDGAVRFSAFERDEAIGVYYGEASSQGMLSLGGVGRVQHVTFQDGRWGEPQPISVTMAPNYASTEGVAVGYLQGKTFLYGFRYILGVVYWGFYGVELREGMVSEPFLVQAPLSEELQLVGVWMTFSVAVVFLAAGGLAGALMLRRVESRALPLVESPYATVTDRGLAAGFDMMLLFTLMNIIPGQWAPGEFWTSFLLAFFAYNVFTEGTGGQTLGKKVVGLRVLTISGEAPTLMHAFRRNVFKPLEMLTVGVGMCLVTSRFQRPGDFLAGTVVIKELRLPRQVEEGEGSGQ